MIRGYNNINSGPLCADGSRIMQMYAVFIALLGVSNLNFLSATTATLAKQHSTGRGKIVAEASPSAAVHKFIYNNEHICEDRIYLC